MLTIWSGNNFSAFIVWPFGPQVSLSMNYSSQRSGIHMVPEIGYPLQMSLASTIPPSDNGTCFPFLVENLYPVRTQDALVYSG